MHIDMETETVRIITIPNGMAFHREYGGCKLGGLPLFIWGEITQEHGPGIDPRPFVALGYAFFQLLEESDEADELLRCIISAEPSGESYYKYVGKLCGPQVYEQVTDREALYLLIYKNELIYIETDSSDIRYRLGEDWQFDELEDWD